jgi:hypothetical protein
MAKGLLLRENQSAGFANPEGPYRVTAAHYGTKTLGVNEMVMLNMSLTSQDDSANLEHSVTVGPTKDFSVIEDGEGFAPNQEGKRCWERAGVALMLNTAQLAAKAVSDDLDALLVETIQEMDTRASALIGWGFEFGVEVQPSKPKAGSPDKPKEYKNSIVTGIWATPDGELGETDAETAGTDGGGEGEDNSPTEDSISTLILSLVKSTPAGLPLAKVASKVEAEITNDHGAEWGEWAKALVETDEFYEDAKHGWIVDGGKVKVKPAKAAPAPKAPAPKVPPAPPAKAGPPAKAVPGKKK